MPPRTLAFRAFIGLALLAAAGCASTTPTVRPEGPEVRDIRIEGASKVSDSDIKKKILTSESGLGFWPFGDKAYFDPNAWQADLRRIERYYQAQGYYQAEVVEDQVTPQKDGVSLAVKVVEGEPTRISKVSITGLEGLPRDHQADARKAVELQEGAIFQEDSWAGQKAKLQGVLKELGYADAAVSGEVHVDVSKRTAEVLLEAIPGERYKFGKIFVSRDPKAQIPVKRIIDQAGGAITPDDWYSESALAEAQARVFKMGVFGGVKVNRGSPEPATGTVPVIVDVREAPFRTQKLGAGFGVDQTRNEVRASVEHTDRNFFGDLRRLTLRAKAGYALLPGLLALNKESTVEKHGFVFNALAELEQPRFLFRDLRLQTSLGAERDLQPAYDYIGGRAKVGVIWQPHPDFSVYPSYNFEGYNLHGNAQPGGSSPTLVLGCRTDPCPVLLSYLEQVIAWDRRDDRNEPRKGFYVSLALQEGGGPLGGGFDFLRILPDARYYKSFFEDRLTLAVKLRLGTLLPGRDKENPGQAQDTPIVSRFFSGGNFMRGFGDRRLSPYDVAAAEGTGKPQTVPIGGNQLFEGSVELRYAVSPKFLVAGFLDTGYVTQGGLNLTPSYIASNLHYAVGLGFRYLTVVGPIRFDLAARVGGPPLERVAGGDPSLVPNFHRGCFGIGEKPASQVTDPIAYSQYPGSPEDLCAFHFSIGEAF